MGKKQPKQQEYTVQ